MSTSDTHQILDHGLLISRLFYDGTTGSFFWRKTDKEAGFKVCNGRYIGIGISGKVYRRGRLAWFYVNGEWPHEEVDHINGNRLDDRIINLREVTRRQNLHNLKRHRVGKLVGATFVKTGKRRKRWMARIKTKSVSKSIGYFKTEKEAHQAYMEACKCH